MSLLPPVFALLKAAPAVTAILGAVPKVYRHGLAPQGTVAPYAVWMVIGDEPQTNLSDPPPTDKRVLQLDCYDTTDGGVEDLAEAVRDALEAGGHVVSIVIDQKEPDTGLFRIGLQADWWQSR